MLVSFLRPHRVAIATLVVAIVTLVHETIHACSPARPSLRPGILLGTNAFSSLPSLVDVPSNFAILERPSVDAGVADEWVPLAELGMFRLATPLAQGETFVLDGGISVVSTGVADTTPPTAPVITNAEVHDESRVSIFTCGRGACGAANGRSASIAFSIAHDETATHEWITYAVFAGASAEAASTATEPSGLFVQVLGGTIRDESGVLGTRETAFVSLAAIDQAGNVSPRSAPVAFSH